MSTATDALVERVTEALRVVIDPELGYNIVDLGLVYRITVAEDGGVSVVMTTTTPGCPATDYLTAGASEAARAVEGVETVDTILTYEPRWTSEMMTPAVMTELTAMPVRPGSPKTNLAGGYCLTRVRMGQLLS